MPEVQMRTECWTRVAPGKKRKDGLKQGQGGLAGKGAGKRRGLTNNPWQTFSLSRQRTFGPGLRVGFFTLTVVRSHVSASSSQTNCFT